MLILDADVLLVNIKYHNDPKFTRNRQALTALVASGIPLGVPTQVILEIVEAMSLNTRQPPC